MAQAERLILASGSPARRDLLTRRGYSFEVIPSGVDEPSAENVRDPRAFVHEVAWLKAAAVARRADDPRALVLAADSVAWSNGQVIGKPVDEADARRILGSLSGTVHELWTGVVLWRVADGWQVCWQEVSRVAMRPLSAAELDELIATGDWKDKSGGYGIQEVGDPYLTVVEGTKSNVIGLPMESLERVLAWVRE
jgi:septum formation protein